MNVATYDKKAARHYLTAVLMCVCCIYTHIVLATDVYVTKDAQGNPIFSDQASENAHKIQVQEIFTVPAEKVPVNSEQSKKNDVQYSDLAIVSPQHDSAVRENSGHVTISASLNPPLRPGHQIIIKMDGQEVSRGSALSVSLENIDRGTHSVSASVLSARSEVLISARPVSFTLLRYRP